MPVDLLDTPLRLTWDLHDSSGPAADGLARSVAQAIVDAQVFFVTLEVRPLAHPAFAQISDILAGGGCTLLVTCSGTDGEMQSLSLLPDSAELLLQADRFTGADGLDEEAVGVLVKQCRQAGVEPSLSLVPTHENVGQIIPLLRLCEQFGIPRFKLPNRRVDDSLPAGFPADLCGPGEIETLRRTLSGQQVDPGSVELEIHDLFLWELLMPGADAGRSEYGGCQAGNSLAHISAKGDVHPCLSWPQVLGNLATDSLFDIWQSVTRLAVRREITETPQGCVGCRDYPICFGGCRGLSRTFDTPGGRDPMCKEPR